MNILELETKFLSKEGDKLPPVLYHGTTLANAEQIIKIGLRPRFSVQRGSYTKGYIFLSARIAGAEAFAPGGEYSKLTEPGAIIEITNTVELASKMRTRLGEFIRCPVVIPPQLLKIIKYTNV